MKRVLRRLPLALAVAMAAVVPAHAVALAPGEVVVVDARAYPPGCADVGAPGCGGLMAVDPGSGAEILLSSNHQPVNASSQLFSIPFTLAFDPAGNVLVANTWAMGGPCLHGCGGVLRIDPSTGAQTVVSSDDQPINATTQYFRQPTGMTVDAAGNILVADWGDCAGCGEVIEVDPVTGKQTLLSSNAMAVNSASQYFKYVQGIAVDHAGNILVTDPLSAGSPPCNAPPGCGAVIEVDPQSGKETRISSNELPVNSSSQYFYAPLGITVDGAGRILVSDASNCCAGVIAVDPQTGKETLVSRDDMPVNATSQYFSSATGIALDAAGTILVADQAAFGGTGGVIAVDPQTGKETELSANEQPVNASNQLYADPFSVAVVPPASGGGGGGSGAPGGGGGGGGTPGGGTSGGGTSGTGPGPPQTTITRATFTGHRSRAAFRFRGSGGSGALRFECRLDRRRFAACRSPRVYRHVAPGRHVFRVRAVDGLGRADPTPALRRFSRPSR